MSSADGEYAAAEPSLRKPERIRKPTLVVFAFALVAWVVLIGYYRLHLEFMSDDWLFISMRMNGGFVHEYLEPYSEHIVLLFVPVYRLALELFGLTDAVVPLHVFAMVAYSGATIAAFVYLRTLVGEYLALLAAIVLLFLGPAFEMLLWSFQSCFAVAMIFGLAGLIMIRREDRHGDIAACLLLTASILTVTMGLPFIVGAAVALLLAPNTIRRSYVVLVPLGIFTVWYLIWGVDGPSYMSTYNLVRTPGYILNAFGHSLMVITGTSGIHGDAGLLIRRFLAFAAIAGIAWRVWRERRVPSPLLIALAAGLVFWGTAGLSQFLDLRTFDRTRYQFPSAVFTMMILAGGWQGYRPRMPARVTFAVLAVVVVWVNIGALVDGYRDQVKPSSDRSVASVASMDLLGPDEVDGDVMLAVDQGNFNQISAGEYFSVRSQFGSDPWTLSEVKKLPDRIRQNVDFTIRDIHPFAVETVPGPAGKCRLLIPGDKGETPFVKLTGPLYFNSAGKGVLKAGRLSDGEIFGIADPTKDWIRVTPPDDPIAMPWRINANSTEPVKVCRGG